MPHGVSHVVLLVFGEAVPPGLEFAGELDFPSHSYSMPYTEYAGEGMKVARELGIAGAGDKKTIACPTGWKRFGENGEG